MHPQLAGTRTLSLGTLVVVNPFSSSRHFARKAHARGLRVVALLADAQVAHAWPGSFDPEEYDRVLVWDAQTTPAELAREPHVVGVLNGIDIGLELCEHVAAMLGVPGNAPATSQRRRHKYHVAARLEGYPGVVLPQRFLAGPDDLPRTLAWAAQVGYPLFVKPPLGCGMAHVGRVVDARELQAMFESILGAFNGDGGPPNREVLIETMLLGEEVIVDTVAGPAVPGDAFGERHGFSIAITDVNRYLRTPRMNAAGVHVDVYDRLLVGAASARDWQRAWAYAESVHLATGFRFGPTHLEAMDAQGAGTPALRAVDALQHIELNARVIGADYAPLVERVYGYSQLDVTLDALLDAQAWAHAVRRSRAGPPELRDVGVGVHLIVDRPGRMRAWTTHEVEQLPSFEYAKFDAVPGTWLRATEDMDSSPGIIYLAGPAAQVDADVRRIRALERANALHVRDERRE